MKKQQVFPPSQAPSQWSRWVTHLYGTSTAPHTCAAHTRTHTHTHTHAVHKQGGRGCVHHTHTKKACCVQDIYIYLQDWPRAPGGITQTYKMNNVCSSSIYFFNVMVHLQTARGTCMYVHLVYICIRTTSDEVRMRQMFHVKHGVDAPPTTCMRSPKKKKAQKSMLRHSYRYHRVFSR